MKLKWRTILILFLSFAVIEIIVKGSNISLITGLEPLIILVLAISSLSSEWAVIFFYLIVTFLVDLINFQILGLAEVSFFSAYLLSSFVNKFIDINSEHKIIFAFLVIILTIVLKMAIGLFFFSINNPVNIAVFFINFGVFLLVYFLINSFNNESVYKR